jgi:hypothetical protein
MHACRKLTTLTARRGVRVSIQRVIQDPIPFVILLGLILLTVWIWRWFNNR